VRYSEAIRGSVLDGDARGEIARTVRSHYERAVVLAAEASQYDLTLEVIERLRTERLAGLFRRRVLDESPEDLGELLDALDNVNEEIARAERPHGIPGR
jgi:hypothetical protein